MNLKEYKKVMENKELLEVTFTMADNTDYVFVTYDGDIEIRMAYKEFFKRANDDELNKQQAIGAVRRPKHVLVTKVDEENKVVHVSYIEAMKKEREKTCKDIDEQLAAGKEVRVTGKVMDVRGRWNHSFAVIAFNNSNVRGIVWCNRWSPSFTTELKGSELIGMDVEVAVIERIKNSRAVKASYVCARDVVIGDIWSGIENKYHKGDILNVKCVEKWGSVYAGTVEGEKELKVRMDMPDKVATNGLMLVPSLIYQCVVVSVNEKEKSFRVKPQRLCHAKPGVRKVTIIT